MNSRHVPHAIALIPILRARIREPEVAIPGLVFVACRLPLADPRTVVSCVDDGEVVARAVARLGAVVQSDERACAVGVEAIERVAEAAVVEPVGIACGGAVSDICDGNGE